MSVYYEVESDTIRIWSQQEPIHVSVRLWAITESSETADNETTSTTTRRLVQSWLLPVETKETNA